MMTTLPAAPADVPALEAALTTRRGELAAALARFDGPAVLQARRDCAALAADVLAARVAAAQAIVDALEHQHQAARAALDAAQAARMRALAARDATYTALGGLGASVEGHPDLAAARAALRAAGGTVTRAADTARAIETELSTARQALAALLGPL